MSESIGKVGRTKDGKPFDFYEKKMVESGKWRPETVPPEVSGVNIPLEIYRAKRKGHFITPWDREDMAGYCPMHWADVKIGQGACGLRCRACFLIATHRVKANPSRHVLYDNVEDCIQEIKRWLKAPNRHTLGLGTDSSDSLLYEGITGYVRRLVPMFASPDFNPHGCKLLLLSKTANAHFLDGLPVRNILVSWSLNAAQIAALWEGLDENGVQITPSMDRRLAASLHVQEMGYEVRWRVDPVLCPDGWKEAYAEFFQDAAEAGHRPTRITLGTYRETSPALRTMAAKWGLPPMGWLPATLVKEGMHYHVPREERIHIYMRFVAIIKAAWAGTGYAPEIALCKEPREVKQAVGLDHEHCNCE